MYLLIPLTVLSQLGANCSQANGPQPNVLCVSLISLLGHTCSFETSSSNHVIQSVKVTQPFSWNTTMLYCMYSLYKCLAKTLHDVLISKITAQFSKRHSCQYIAYGEKALWSFYYFCYTPKANIMIWSGLWQRDSMLWKWYSRSKTQVKVIYSHYASS